MTEAGDDAVFAPPQLDSAAPRATTGSGFGPPSGEPATTAAPGSAPSKGKRQPGPGQLRWSWRAWLFVGFLLALTALGSVWAVASQIGHTTWWMGPAGDPHWLIVQLVPFYIPVFVVFGTILNRPGVSFLGIVAGVVELVIGGVDLVVYPTLGILEGAIGLLMVGMAVASLAGVIRAERPVGDDVGSVAESG